MTKIVRRTCEACSAGALTGFDWLGAMMHGSSETRATVKSLEVMMPLRRGILYQCRACNQPWHLDGGSRWMTIVPRERMPLIRAWNEAPIMLSRTVTQKLAGIGCIRAVHVNGGDLMETPCGVLTHSGERIDLAFVAIQKDAPVEEWRTYRLGSEIADVYPSPYALPLDVREAGAAAQERAMGFAPSLIVMPDGQSFTLNGRTSFLTEPGYRAPEARISSGGIDDNALSKLPPIASGQDVVRFVADGPAGEV